MDRDKRINYFDDLKKNGKSIGSMDLWYKNGRTTFPVYEIDLKYLIYNRFNGRIASLVKSYEKETGKALDPTDLKDKARIEKFLWDSNESSNKTTEKSISTQGQLKYGIVTKDGVIIDGNRRSMVLNRVFKDEPPVYFRAVVLSETLDENAEEIMRLETTFQMGEDAKVDYNPIEKYLKVKDMLALKFSHDGIGKAMGETDTTIKEYEQIMILMDEYLDQLGYSGIYTRLDKTEDLFINLNTVLKRWESTSGKVQWNYKEKDLSDFKLICFDLIRYVYNSPKGIQAKDVREHLTRNSENSFFAHKDIWQDFSNRHFTNVDPTTNAEKSVDELRRSAGSRELSSILKSRDETWARDVDSAIKENFGRSKESLENLHDKNEPLKLLQSALAKLEAIDTGSKAFLEDENVYVVVDDVRKTADTYKKTITTHRKQR